MFYVSVWYQKKEMKNDGGSWVAAVKSQTVSIMQALKDYKEKGRRRGGGNVKD